MFLGILQNSQENNCVRVSFLIKLQARELQLYLKKRLWHRSLPVNFAKFVRTLSLQNTSRRLLLLLWICISTPVQLGSSIGITLSIFLNVLKCCYCWLLQNNLWPMFPFYTPGFLSFCEVQSGNIGEKWSYYIETSQLICRAINWLVSIWWQLWSTDSYFVRCLQRYTQKPSVKYFPKKLHVRLCVLIMSHTRLE